MPCKLSTHVAQKFRYETVPDRRLFPALPVVSFRHFGLLTLRHRRGQQARRGQRSWPLARRVVPHGHPAASLAACNLASAASSSTTSLRAAVGADRTPWLDPAAPFPFLPQEVLDLLDELRRVGLLGLERAPCLATRRVVVLL